MASSDIEVDLDEVQEAAKRVAQYINRTPVMTCSTLDSMAGRSLHFKCELFQKTGSFKVGSWLYGRLSDRMFHFFPRTPPTLWMSRFLPPQGFVGTLWKKPFPPPPALIFCWSLSKRISTSCLPGILIHRVGSVFVVNIKIPFSHFLNQLTLFANKVIFEWTSLFF